MEVPPFDLQAVARALARDVVDVRRGLRQVRDATAAVSLHPADPALGARFLRRRATVLSRLGRPPAALDATAEELMSAAVAAVRADERPSGPTWEPLLCRLPDRKRSELDRWLTDRLGAGLTGVATGAIRLAELVASFDDDPVSGDAGGTFSTRRVPFAVASSDHSDAAGLIAGALDATADTAVLAHDEFGLVDLGDDRYTVVLPGVTDLTRPGRGWNPVHRSPRDLDMAALASARSSSLDDNRYGLAVADALIAVGVPAGAELMIVGHSFGADTALDLAADPAFSERYRVRRVVATGHFARPAPSSIPLQSAVLVVQNRRDLVAKLGAEMPSVEQGVLACDRAEEETGGRTVAIEFDGGTGGLGHSVEVYRSVFTDHAGLSAADAAAVDDVLASFDGWSDTPPESMLAVDISLPGS